MKCRECSRELELKSKKNKETGMYYQDWECIACGVVKDPMGMKGVQVSHPNMKQPFQGIDWGFPDVDIDMNKLNVNPKIKYVPGYGFKVLDFDGNELEGFTLADCFKKGKI